MRADATVVGESRRTYQRGLYSNKNHARLYLGGVANNDERNVGTPSE